MYFLKKTICLAVILCMVLTLGVSAYAETVPLTLTPGDIIEFGSYEQDNITTNGPEPIEWQVLEVNDDEAFLVSVYLLDVMPFNNEIKSSAKKNLTWIGSDIRAWLNGDFLKTAFTESERNGLITVTHEAGAEDLVFLLRQEEVEKFFPSSEEQHCEPTEYAYVKEGTRDYFENLGISFEFDLWTYYLRSFSPSGKRVDGVNALGTVDVYEKDLKFIRPAIKIDLTKSSTILGKLNSRYIETPVSDPNEISFLQDMALGLNKRLLSSDDASSGEDFQKLVSYEVDAISKYENTVFPNPEFDRFVHDYLDALGLQQKALEYYGNDATFDPIWNSGRLLRSELIVEGYEKFGLDIREEDYLSYKNALKPDHNSSGRKDDEPTIEFLKGYWSSRNGMHTFEMKDNDSYVTTVPVVPHCGDTYILENGVIRSYYASNPNQKTDNLKITVISDIEIEIYSYQTKMSYTLFKRR